MSKTQLNLLQQQSHIQLTLAFLKRAVALYKNGADNKDRVDELVAQRDTFAADYPHYGREIAAHRKLSRERCDVSLEDLRLNNIYWKLNFVGDCDAEFKRLVRLLKRTTKRIYAGNKRAGDYELLDDIEVRRQHLLARKRCIKKRFFK